MGCNPILKRFLFVSTDFNESCVADSPKVQIYRNLIYTVVGFLGYWYL